ncbi:hypothetical protein HPB48_005219 [Haemaphysalis longicornis]|uniref:Uncharacterized protein n=1 Tax=Haemaphysalis longicornis TaxID=44386 RepID=A0A9J6FEA5_HAELO|nr:hypothetical protein HPB48_005219 [Haemaphysalis longicornis]
MQSVLPACSFLSRRLGKGKQSGRYFLPKQYCVEPALSGVACVCLLGVRALAVARHRACRRQLSEPVASRVTAAATPHTKQGPNGVAFEMQTSRGVGWDERQVFHASQSAERLPASSRQAAIDAGPSGRLACQAGCPWTRSHSRLRARTLAIFEKHGTAPSAQQRTASNQEATLRADVSRSPAAHLATHDDTPRGLSRRCHAAGVQHNLKFCLLGFRFESGRAADGEVESGVNRTKWMTALAALRLAVICTPPDSFQVHYLQESAVNPFWPRKASEPGGPHARDREAAWSILHSARSLSAGEFGSRTWEHRQQYRSSQSSRIAAAAGLDRSPDVGAPRRGGLPR